MLPPDAYFLSSIEFQTQVLIKKNNLKAIIKVDNVFDATYRDYLNRLRYFANDIGRNVLVSLQWKF
jgi:iron complex outermembrane receptor protein